MIIIFIIYINDFIVSEYFKRLIKQMFTTTKETISVMGYHLMLSLYIQILNTIPLQRTQIPH